MRLTPDGRSPDESEAAPPAPGGERPPAGPAENDAAVPQPGRRKWSRRKVWCFRLAAVVLALVLLLLVEVTLRAAGVGQDLRLVQPVPGDSLTLTHQVNEAVDLAYFAAANVTGPEPRRFALPKPDGTFRIVFLGGSTVIGFPYLPEVAFPRQVEVQLAQQNPGRTFEVLNIGITAMNSFAVVDLLKQCFACDPDLIVIHSGHNEFYGPGGAASTAVGLPHALVGPIFALRRCRIPQLVGTLVPGGDPVRDDLLDVLPRTQEIPLGGAIFEQAQNSYRRNLEQAADLARRKGVPLVLSTVACNLRDQSPLKAIWPKQLAPEQQQQWESHVSAAESLLQQQPAAALEELEAAAAILEGHARLTYRTAQCLQALGRDDEALAAYQQARDEDACRFRAPSMFAQIVREVADARGETVFLDVEAQVNAAGHPAGPGNDLFFEHVHYTFDGHYLLGRIFAQAVQEDVLQSAWTDERSVSLEDMEDLLGVIPEDHLAAYSHAIEVLQTGPLKSALDASRHEEYIISQIAERYRELDPPRREGFADVALSSMMSDLVGALTHIHRRRGNIELADELSQLAERRRPWLVEER